MEKHKGLKRFLIFLLILAIFWTVINLIPQKKIYDDNPYITDGLPIIAAHRGGADNNPQNTMLAFKEAVNTIGVDILECDVQLTKDGELIFCHNDYIDLYCNINGDISEEEVETLCENEENRHFVKNFTLDELREYNFGYYFEDENGERIYRDATDISAMGLSPITPKELFDEFYEKNPDLMFIIEIKNGGELGREATDKLCQILNDYPEYKKNTVIGSFHPEIGTYIKNNHSDFYRGATILDNIVFIVTNALGLNLFDGGNYACLQIPIDYDIGGVNLKVTTEAAIKKAHDKGIAVQCWTINDPNEMRMLIEMGVDCIMTDNPKLLKSVLEEYK